MSQQFDRPDQAAQKEFKEQLRREAPTAMADYMRAYDAKIERMFQLRRMRLANQGNNSNAQQRADGQ
jgi:hypothetical protein